jgi:hypothetical protein
LPSWRSWDERVCYQVEKVTEQPPEIGPAFEAMMREIDAKFAKEGMPITARPIRAIGVISGRYRVAMPITDPLPGSPPELLRYAPLRGRLETLAGGLEIRSIRGI